jgi:hypothetical protein
LKHPSIVALAFVVATAGNADAQNPFRRGDPPKPGPPVASIQFDREAYENLQNFADGLYKQKERPDFKQTVDREFEAILREHGKRAYEVNTSPHSEIRRILEDRYREFSGLYDNLMVQDLVNQIGQEVVPKWSDKLVTFKLIADPVPRAEAMATGTIYISTGLAAALDNKAQLAYILAHEAAHVARGHWKQRVLIERAKDEYAKANAQNGERMKRWGALVGLGAGALIGGMTGNTVAGATLGTAIGYSAVAVATSRERPVVDWNQFEEDEADDVALKTMLDAKIDVRQVPTLYLAMDKLSLRDDRVGMGFWGNRDRMRERLETVNKFVTGNVKEGTALTGSDATFRRLIAELKRDNGILSFHYDMLEAARSNLEQAVDVRDSDPVALYYYAKILKATSKTPDEHAAAGKMFLRAMQRDSSNQAYGAYLHSAVTILDDATPEEKRQAAEWLSQYVDRYRRSKDEESATGNKNLPPHMDTIIDYMRRAGVENPTINSITNVSAPVAPRVDPVKPGAKPAVKPAAQKPSGQ